MIHPGDRLENPGDRRGAGLPPHEEARFLCEIRPALAFESLIDTMFTLAAEGRTNRRGLPSPLRLAVIGRRHFDTVRLPFPPAWLQRAALAVGAPLGRALRYRTPRRPPDRYGSRGGPATVEGTPMGFVSRGFRGRRRAEGPPGRVPPGQYVVTDFPVLSAGPTPDVGLDEWRFTIAGEVDDPVSWSWDELRALPSERITRDIHCVTKWSKLDTDWEGVSLDVLLDGVETAAEYGLVRSYGGYTTNLPLEDLIDGKAWVAYAFDGAPLEPEHGGPARLLVPHLYFWKSAKWVTGIDLLAADRPGFWESYGYHNYGDPWREQRYAGD